MKGFCPSRIRRVTKIIIVGIIALMTVAAPVHGRKILNHLGKELGRRIGKQILNDVKKTENQWKKDRRKIQKETCRLFKDLLIQKRIKKSDLELIEGFIDDRLPRNWKPKRRYISDLERVGYKLIDPDLTIVDYEYLRDILNRIWNTRPYNPWHIIIWNTLGDYGRQNYYRPPLPGGMAL